MTRMFCTLKEAAETLHASEDQIRTLLERGILHEFRQGPHRLLKEDEVGVLASVAAGRTTPEEAPAAARAQDAERMRASSRPASDVLRNELRHRLTSPRSRPPSPRSRPSLARDARRRGSAAGERQTRRPLPAAPRLSVRQWFWIGLIQDRPLVIALLSGLLLAGLSAVTAGLCFLAES